jgi:predicted kinase
LKGVHRGDHVYVNTPRGPCSGEVKAVGKHGCTVHIDGATHKVPWDRILGHKLRVQHEVRMIDDGEDGAIVEMPDGERRFVAGPVDEGTEDERAAGKLVKAIEVGARVIFKAGDVKGRPGLALQQVTDRMGHTTRRWKRTQEDMPKGRPEGGANAGAERETRGSAAGYGTHNLGPGDAVKFEAGGARASGKIVAAGKDGATVHDGEREHQVLWSEIRGHESQAKGKSAPSDAGAAGQGAGADARVPPEEFSAVEHFHKHNEPDVTAEAIIAKFPPDTAGKIKDAVDRLESIEQTIDRYKKDGKYLEARRAKHDEIINSFLSPDKVEKATPKDGAAPTFTILGGRGRSGKSWFTGKVFDPESAIVLDADHIKGMLPEYEGWNAQQVHEESSDLFDKITDMAQEMGLNIVHDATMKTKKKAVALVQRFKDAGYRAEAHYMHLPRQEAARRAVERFLGKTRRFVPPEVVLSNTGNEESFDAVRGLVDKWSFRDNNVPFGQEPVLISEGGRSDENGTGKDEELGDGARGPVRERLPSGSAGNRGEGSTGPGKDAGGSLSGGQGRLRKAFERLRKTLSGRPDLWAAKPTEKPVAERPTVMFFRRPD